MWKLIVFIITALPVVARAEGINLSWDDCGSAGTSLKSFACDTNDGGPEVLVVSFVPPPGIEEFVGVAAQINILSSSPELPDWWKFSSICCPFLPQQCRDSTGLVLVAGISNAPVLCPTPFTNGVANMTWEYKVGHPTSNMARFRMSANGPADRPFLPLLPTVEYTAFHLIVSHDKTVGPEACSGCREPMCIVLNSVIAYEPPDQPLLEITTPLVRNYVTWQSTEIAGCPDAVPARPTTWGRIKSMYR